MFDHSKDPNLKNSRALKLSVGLLPLFTGGVLALALFGGSVLVLAVVEKARDASDRAT